MIHSIYTLLNKEVGKENYTSKGHNFKMMSLERQAFVVNWIFLMRHTHKSDSDQVDKIIQVAIKRFVI